MFIIEFSNLRRLVMLTSISTGNAPQPTGPYSQAIQYGNIVYISGQTPLMPNGQLLEHIPLEGGQLMQHDVLLFDEQTRQVFRNIEAISKAAGGDLNHIAKLTVYVSASRNNFARFRRFNGVMSEVFSDHHPACSIIGVSSLPDDVDIEIDAIMILDE